MKVQLTLAVLLVNILLSAQELPDKFYKRFEGTIDGKYNITINLVRIDSVLIGNYYYNNKGELIQFIRSSIDSAGNIYLEEDAGIDEKNNPLTTGIFKGKFYPKRSISGKWEDPDSKRVLNFSVDEKYPPGSTALTLYYNLNTYSDYGRASIEAITVALKDFPDRKIEEKINNYFLNNLTLNNFSDALENYSSIDEMMDSFIEMYKKDIVEDSVTFSDYIPEYESSNLTEVLYNSDYLLSLQNIYYSYTGGAHPNTYIKFLNFDLHTGEPVKLDNIFKPGYSKKLNELGEKKFREYYELDESKSLDEAGFYFENGFQLNENFSLTKAGIRFLFNQYEAAPYVLGAPEVYFSFDEIRDLIKEDSLIGKMQ